MNDDGSKKAPLFTSSLRPAVSQPSKPASTVDRKTSPEEQLTANISKLSTSQETVKAEVGVRATGLNTSAQAFAPSAKLPASPTKVEQELIAGDDNVEADDGHDNDLTVNDSHLYTSVKDWEDLGLNADLLKAFRRFIDN